MSRLTEEQILALLRPIKPSRVMQANGQSHVPAYDVAAHLTRVLGFGGWDQELISSTLLFETSSAGERPKWTVGYSALVRLIIKNVNGVEVARYENGACGDAVNQPSRADAHHLAMTTAISTALKRCAAFGLGDQFGLSLYNKGSESALIGKTLVMPGSAPQSDTDLESHIVRPESLGNDERQGTPEANTEQSGGQSGQLEQKQQSGPTTLAPDFSALQKEIKSHPRYTVMDSTAKGRFLSDHAGYEVRNIRELSDSDCEQILAALRNSGPAYSSINRDDELAAELAADIAKVQANR